MIVLVLGRNGSGKSAYAEKLASRMSAGELYYIATMLPYGEEGRARVEKHRAQRGPFNFITVEKPYHVSETRLPPNAAILLEDASNLLGNALFGNGGGSSEPEVFGDIEALCAKCRAAVLVSISGLDAPDEYSEETRGYIGSLNRLNSKLSDFADIVVEMRDGTPVLTKGDKHALD